MRVVVIVLAALALATAVPATSLGQPQPPSLAPAQMNCGDTKTTDDSHLSEAQARHIARSLAQVWEARSKRSEWRHGRHLDAYTLAFCGTNTGGHQVIIVDGIYNFLGSMICDDAAGFGVVYDPRSGQFGDLVFGVSSCVPASSGTQGSVR